MNKKFVLPAESLAVSSLIIPAEPLSHASGNPHASRSCPRVGAPGAPGMGLHPLSTARPL
ncbi:MAG: hypothetical protein ACYDHX_08505 [Methanothrix sp.]